MADFSPYGNDDVQADIPAAVAGFVAAGGHAAARVVPVLRSASSCAINSRSPSAGVYLYHDSEYA